MDTTAIPENAPDWDDEGMGPSKVSVYQELGYIVVAGYKYSNEIFATRDGK